MADSTELDRLSAFVGRPLPDRRDVRLSRGRSEWTPLLRMGRLLAERRTGMRVDAVREDLDALRQAQIDDVAAYAPALDTVS